MRINEVLTPTSLVDALVSLKRVPDAVICAGGTTLFGEEPLSQSGPPTPLLSLHTIPELKAISRTDRYVEVGAMTPLSELLRLKEGFIPEALRKMLRNVGTFAVRNLATIGGNLSCGHRFRDCFPVLASMDALAEFRHVAGARWVNLNRLVDARGYPDIPKGEILTRIRVPLTEWNINIVQKMGTPRICSEQAAVFVFLVRMEKRVISDFRIFYTYGKAIRNREAESAIEGKKTPLSARELDTTLAAYGDLCRQAELPQTQTFRFLSLVRKAFTLVNEGKEQ